MSFGVLGLSAGRSKALGFIGSTIRACQALSVLGLLAQGFLSSGVGFRGLGGEGVGFGV